MDFFQAIILSVVEGITEFLPISSTGHLILASDLLKILQTDFVKSFEIIIQLGAILAVFILYFKKFLNIRLWPVIVAGLIPTAILGFVFYQIVKTYLLGNTTVVLIALFLGGFALIALEKYYGSKFPHSKDRQIQDLSLKQAVVIGIIQSVSIIPGVSRSAATIFGGMFVGLNRQSAVEFSFLLAVPTMLAATTLDVYKSNFQFTPAEFQLLAVGFIGAFITATLAVKFFIKFIEAHTFIPFGIYRIILAVIFWVFIT